MRAAQPSLVEISDEKYEPIVSQSFRTSEDGELWVFRVPNDFDQEELDGVSIDVKSLIAAKAQDERYSQQKVTPIGKSGLICRKDDPVLAKDQLQILFPTQSCGNSLEQGRKINHCFSVGRPVPTVEDASEDSRKEKLKNLLKSLTPPNARVEINLVKPFPPNGESRNSEEDGVRTPPKRKRSKIKEEEVKSKKKTKKSKKKKKMKKK
mmetsp:Transcript_9838/g.11801  ORF Transcript_9838/g.11801 Transcript_9838/m.11801 type:complete len:208 (+) Transcript_9838:180-803(+)|eukprot:CAMPEP_0184034790 /NCGR_PEP_ID=MMETSP0955-20130417/19461_1 /TAXON_ID=627963 /ORGANISM="Aplanochytrium sp, Strain PBS07" /LENGTH=207 /DNA_ID=CAMNT_0026321675 /DNA_START=119 /DNA_END=742 /DNA_ORIENTATION=+